MNPNCFVCGDALDHSNRIALKGRGRRRDPTLYLHRSCATQLAVAALSELHRVADHPAPIRSAGLQASTAERFDLRPAELAVLDGIAAGKTNRQIARDTGLTLKTVKNKVSLVLAKLAVSSRVEAAIVALREGLVEQP